MMLFVNYVNTLFFIMKTRKLINSQEQKNKRKSRKNILMGHSQAFGLTTASNLEYIEFTFDWQSVGPF